MIFIFWRKDEMNENKKYFLTNSFYVTVQIGESFLQGKFMPGESNMPSYTYQPAYNLCSIHIHQQEREHDNKIIQKLQVKETSGGKSTENKNKKRMININRLVRTYDDSEVNETRSYTKIQTKHKTKKG